ncbi:MAG TPA: cell surface protein, partial [Opitutaceae bacterium]|nr:cell surface protein [Opitutaceae bacterium]
MDLKRISVARQFIPASAAALALVFLCGCSTLSLTNLTPSTLPSNPSGIYTFTLRVTPKTTLLVPDSVAPHIVVGAESHDMVKDP